MQMSEHASVLVLVTKPRNGNVKNAGKNNRNKKVLKKKKKGAQGSDPQPAEKKERSLESRKMKAWLCNAQTNNTCTPTRIYRVYYFLSQRAFLPGLGRFSSR